MFQTKRMKILLSCIIALSVILTPHCSAFAEENALPPDKTIPMRPETMEAYSNRQVHPFSTQSVTSSFDIEKFITVTQSSDVELLLNKQMHTIRLRDKKTGYVWGALPLEEAEGLNSAWINYGNSIAGIECFDVDGIEKRYGINKNATVTYSMLDDGFKCLVDFTKLNISFEVTVRLTENRLNFSVDEKTISEGEEVKLKSIMFMPYFGAGYSDTLDGYILIPDGSGALIRFQKPKSYSAAFSKKVYGKDLAIDVLADAADINASRSNDYIVTDPQILMPVYGVVHGHKQNGFLGVIENGAEYASIIANPASLNNPYNWGGVRFEFRQKFNLSTNRKEGEGAIVPQQVRNVLSPSLSLHFLNGNDAGYDKMAVYYRELLDEQGVLARINPANNIPLKLEVLGASKKNGFLSPTAKFSTFDDAKNMALELKAANVENVSLVMRGFTKLNENGMDIESKVGRKKDVIELNALMTELGGRFYLHNDPISANIDQINLRTEAANNLSNIIIDIKRPNYGVLYQDNYFYRLSQAEKRIDKTMKMFPEIPFSIDSLGYRLYGDYTTASEFTRAENMAKTVELANTLCGENKAPFYQPNQFLWEIVSEFYDIPVVSSQYLFETDTVPFLQIVLSGRVNMFATPLNAGTYSQNRLLRLAEYGVYPSFTVTQSSSEALYNTAFEDNFSTKFTDWQSSIKQAYNQSSTALKPVLGEEIISHDVVLDGFTATEYSNGVKVLVNYTDKPKMYIDILVPAYDFIITQAIN